LTAADGIYTPVNLVSSPDCTSGIQGVHSGSGNETTVNLHRGHVWSSHSVDYKQC